MQMVEENYQGKKLLMDNSYIVFNVYSFYGGVVVFDDVVGVFV